MWIYNSLATTPRTAGDKIVLSDKQIQEISKAAADIAVSLDMHPCLWVVIITLSLPGEWRERRAAEDKCQQWLFDNQESYPFSITKEDMSY